MTRGREKGEREKGEDGSSRGRRKSDTTAELYEETLSGYLA